MLAWKARPALVAAALITGAAVESAVTNRPAASCDLSLSTLDGRTGTPTYALVRLETESGKAVPLGGLLPRGTGLRPELPVQAWSVLPGRATLQVPCEPLSVFAFQGLDSRLGRALVAQASSPETPRTAMVRLDRFYDVRAAGLTSANTHVHLRDVSLADADRYLQEIPRADGLDIVFLLYQERADRTYSSNVYTPQSLEQLSRLSGVRFVWGEEHRHDFRGAEGYGHVLLLNLRRLVQPVSIGPALMQAGTDGIPLRRGMDETIRNRGTVVWSHNRSGLEEVASWVSGRVHAQNIFDGINKGSYADSVYRYLNAGFHVPLSTGTDMFIYDFSRTYVRSGPKATADAWLDRLRTGHSFITNGPFLELEVDGRAPGERLLLGARRDVRVRARGMGRSNFGALELVQNGDVIRRSGATFEDGVYRAAIDVTLRAEEPFWLAARVPPPRGDKSASITTPVNEFGHTIFAHTSAVSVEIAGRTYEDRRILQTLLAEIKQNRSVVLERGSFASEEEESAVVRVYDDAVDRLRKRLKGLTKNPGEEP